MMRFVCKCGMSYARLDEFCAHLAVCGWPEPATSSYAATQRAHNASRQRARRAAMTPEQRASYNRRETARQRRRRTQQRRAS